MPVSFVISCWITKDSNNEFIPKLSETLAWLMDTNICHAKDFVFLQVLPMFINPAKYGIILVIN